jgi:hypothetical protein
VGYLAGLKGVEDGKISYAALTGDLQGVPRTKRNSKTIPFPSRKAIARCLSERVTSRPVVPILSARSIAPDSRNQLLLKDWPACKRFYGKWHRSRMRKEIKPKRGHLRKYYMSMDIHRVVYSFFLFLILTGCAKRTAAESGTQTVVVKSQVQRETETQKPEATPLQKEATPTLRSIRRITPTPSLSQSAKATESAPSATPTVNLEDLRADFADLIREYLEQGGGSNEVQSVRSVHFSQGGFFDIELEALWPSRELQPSVAFEVVYWLGKAWADSPEELFYRLSGQDRFVVRLVTYSSEGENPHTSETDLATVQKVGKMEITYEEWKVASNAGFRP